VLSLPDSQIFLFASIFFNGRQFDRFFAESLDKSICSFFFSSKNLPFLSFRLIVSINHLGAAFKTSLPCLCSGASIPSLFS